MSFVKEFSDYKWEEVKHSIYSKTPYDVELALSKSRLDIEDFKALVSPVASEYLQQMAQKSFVLTRKRFGSTLSFFLPFYLSNLCANSCTYCGFSMENRIKRAILKESEILDEVAAIKGMNYDHALLVTGEHENKVGMKYFREVIPTIKKHFTYLAMEVQPLDKKDYVELIGLGIDSVNVYQETYHTTTYKDAHLRGNKRDFNYRLDTPDRLARAGIDRIGIGSLIGLDDWRTDAFFVAAHLSYLERTYWRTRYSISFPRLRPFTGGLEPKSVIEDRELLQLICAYRLFNPEVELSISTRESSIFRDAVMQFGVTSISAASRTRPGGYSGGEEVLEQFAISDDRPIAEVVASIKRNNMTPVWKDWEHAYSG